jgi:hypothetical protein
MSEGSHENQHLTPWVNKIYKTPKPVKIEYPECGEVDEVSLAEFHRYPLSTYHGAGITIIKCGKPPIILEP